MQVGDLYHSGKHGLIVVRQVALTPQSMNGQTLYKVVVQVVAEGNLYSARITRDSFHQRFKRL